MQKPDELGQYRLFAVLVAGGWLAQANHVHIPHTEAMIDGRWLFGYVGFVMLRRWQAAMAMAACLSVPFGSDGPVFVGFVGNLSFALPTMVVLRGAASWMLDRWGPGWRFGAALGGLVLACYQVFTTPVVWAVTGWLRGRAVVPSVLEGWRLQPLLVESVLVAFGVAVLAVALSAHERMLAERCRLDRVNNLLRGVRDVGRAIVVETTAQGLVERACQALVSSMGYCNAWMALVDERGLGATASAGFDGEFDGLRRVIEGGAYPACMRRALDGAATVFVTDPPSECPDCPMSSAYGGRAGLCRALRWQGRTVGVLAVSTPGEMGGDGEEQALFAELADDLAFGLVKLEQARALADSERFLQTVLRTTADGFVVVDGDGTVVDVNRAYCAMTGFERDDVLGRTVGELDADESTEGTAARLERIVRVGSERFQTRHRRRDGGTVPVEVSVTWLGEGRRCFVCFCRDVTECSMPRWRP